MNNMEEDLEGEIWEPVVGYEGLYQISNMGRVYSCPKEWEIGMGKKRKHNGKFLSSSKSSNGYLKVELSKEGKCKTIMVHQLVTMTFLGHVPDGHNMVVDHKDNNPSNNRLDNLQLISQRENTSKDKKGGYTSKYIGVSWHKESSKWVVRITINGRLIHLGLFEDEKEAGEIYQAALSNIDKYFGNPKEFRDYLNNI